MISNKARKLIDDAIGWSQCTDVGTRKYDENGNCVDGWSYAEEARYYLEAYISELETANDLIEVTEYCPFCDSETVIYVARIEILEQMKGRIVCQNCGELILVCSECTTNNCKKQPDCFELREEWKDD